MTVNKNEHFKDKVIQVFRTINGITEKLKKKLIEYGIKGSGKFPNDITIHIDEVITNEAEMQFYRASNVGKSVTTGILIKQLDRMTKDSISSERMYNTGTCASRPIPSPTDLDTTKLIHNTAMLGECAGVILENISKKKRVKSGKEYLTLGKGDGWRNKRKSF